MHLQRAIKKKSKQRRTNMTKKNGKMMSKDASRIQRSTALSNDGKVSKGSFASRAQRAGAKNDHSDK